MNYQTLRSILMPNFWTSHRESWRQEASSSLGSLSISECKATMSSQPRYKAGPVVLTWFRNKVTTTRSVLDSTKSAHKKSWYSRLNSPLRTLLSDPSLPGQDSQLQLQLKTKDTSDGRMINKMRWCRKLIGHRHITDRYVALHHKHLRNASSSLQGDAQLTLAYNMNKNSRVMLNNSLFMSSSFSKIVLCHLHIV